MQNSKRGNTIIDTDFITYWKEIKSYSYGMTDDEFFDFRFCGRIETVENQRSDAQLKFMDSEKRCVFAGIPLKYQMMNSSTNSQKAPLLCHSLSVDEIKEKFIENVQKLYGEIEFITSTDFGNYLKMYTDNVFGSVTDSAPVKFMQNMWTEYYGKQIANPDQDLNNKAKELSEKMLASIEECLSYLKDTEGDKEKARQLMLDCGFRYRS